MFPLSYGAWGAYAFIPIVVAYRSQPDYDTFNWQLTASEVEAVDRVRDQFHSRAELKAFVKGLRG